MDNYTKEQVDIINQRIKELNSLYHAAAVKSGISDGEVQIWSALLNSQEEYSQQDFVEELYLPKQTVNYIISNLMKKGFVYLEHVQGTRNKKVIRLTDEGRTYGERKVMWIFQAEQKAMEETDRNEVQLCISMLEKYILRLREQIDKKNERKSSEDMVP